MLHVGGKQPDPLPSSTPVQNFQWLLPFLLFGGGFVCLFFSSLLSHCDSKVNILDFCFFKEYDEH